MEKRGKKKRRWILYALIGFLFAGVFAVGLSMSDPPPPAIIRLATGSEGGAYAAFGQRFKARLAELGLEAILVNTKGSLENYRLLTTEDPEQAVDIAFVQGGIREASFPSAPGQTADLEAIPLSSIADLYSEPLWLFFRSDTFADRAIDRLTEFVGKEINIGPPGSGTQPVAKLLLDLNGIGKESMMEYSNQDAIAKLQAGEIDALFLITSPMSPNIQMLLRDADIELFDFRRHIAYSRQLPYLSEVRLAEGVLDLLENLPREDVSLLSPKAFLACRSSTHPRVVELFFKTATEIFSGGNVIDPPGRYPSITSSELLVHPAAEEFARSGEGWLNRNFPFWATRLISQLKLLLIPILTVLLPALKIMPKLVATGAKIILKKHYKELEQFEERCQQAKTPDELRQVLKEVDSLREKLAPLSSKLPAQYQPDLYHWRLHLSLVSDENNKRLRQMEC